MDKLKQVREALESAQQRLGADRLSLDESDKEQWDYYKRAMDALASLDAVASEPVQAIPLNRSEARLALWQAIQNIRIGNKHDDKLILEELNRAGFGIASLSQPAESKPAEAAGAKTSESLKTWPEQLSDERKAFEARWSYLDLSRELDLWGREQYKHPHVQSLWQGWLSRSLFSGRKESKDV